MPQKRRSYGPAPNSAVQMTNWRTLNSKRPEAPPLPLVMVDHTALGIPPPKH